MEGVGSNGTLAISGECVDRGERIGDSFSRRAGVSGSTDITRAERLVDQRSLNRLQDRSPRLEFAEMIEHHRRRPDLADGIGDAFPSNVWSGPMHGFEERREAPLRIDVARRSDADGSGAGRSEVGENVAEEV